MAPKILLLALRGRDSAVIGQILDRQSIDCTICTSVGDLAAKLDDDASAAIVTEESLEGMAASGLPQWLKGPVAWSDFPFILRTKRVGKRPKRRRWRSRRLATSWCWSGRSTARHCSRRSSPALRVRRRMGSPAPSRQAAIGRGTAHPDEQFARAVDRRADVGTVARQRPLIREIAERERAQSALVQSQKMEAVGQLTAESRDDSTIC